MSVPTSVCPAVPSGRTAWIWVSTFARPKKLSLRTKAMRPSASILGSLSKMGVWVIDWIRLPSGCMTNNARDGAA